MWDANIERTLCSLSLSLSFIEKYARTHAPLIRSTLALFVLTARNARKVKPGTKRKMGTDKQIGEREWKEERERQELKGMTMIGKQERNAKIPWESA